MQPLLILDIPSVGRAYRLVAEPTRHRSTCTTITAGTASIVHHRHATVADALADLLLTMIGDGSAVIEPLCARAAASQVGWRFGRPGFPSFSGVLRRRAEDQRISFELVVMEYARGIQAVMDEAETRGVDLPAWLPIPAWADVALMDIEVERMVAAGFG